MSREWVHVDVMSRVCQGRRSMLTLVISFWCKTYILDFIDKKRIHVEVMSREILSMSTLCQGSRSMLTLCQGYVKGGGCVDVGYHFLIKTYILYFINKKGIHVDVMSTEYCPCWHYVKGDIIHVVVMSRE